MVRGDAPAATDSHTAAVAHWYSADGALLRLDRGRIQGFTEMGRAWVTVSTLPAPDWHAVSQGSPQSFERVVDEQPGYRLGQRWQRDLVLSESPPEFSSQVSHRWSAVPPSSVQWFEERAAGAARTPSFWYAVDLSHRPGRLVYGRACLSTTLCLEWAPSARTEL